VGCLIVTLASLAATLVAIGEPLPPQTDGLALELTWEAPQGCPDLGTERAEISRRVGDIGRRVPSAPIAAEGTIQRDPSGYRLLLRTRVGDTRGERVLTGENCRELATAAALVLALLLNPEAAPSLDPEPAPAVPTPTPTPTPIPMPPSPKSPPSSVRRPSGLGCGVDAVLARGVLPSLAGGLVGRFFYQRGLVMAAVQVAGFLPQTESAPVLPGASARFYRLESALEVCAGTSSDRRLGGMLCFGGAAVRLHGQSAGVSAPGTATAYWWEGSLAAAGSLRVTASVRLRLATELRGLGSRPDFVIVGLGSTYRPAPLSGRSTLGIDVLF
jgi:hypothetical protein